MTLRRCRLTPVSPPTQSIAASLVHMTVVVRPVFISLQTFTVLCLLCADTVTGLPFYPTLHNFIFTFLNFMQILDWLILAVNHPVTAFRCQVAGS